MKRYMIVLTAAALCGCSAGQYRIGSARGEVPLPHDFSPDCVSAAIAGTPGATDVRYHEASNGDSLAPSSRHARMTAYDMRWSYVAGGHAAHLRIAFNAWGSIGEYGAASFSNDVRQDQPIPAEVRAAVEPVLQAVDRAIDTGCNLPLKN
jgi:hypothetical protein